MTAATSKKRETTYSNYSLRQIENALKKQQDLLIAIKKEREANERKELEINAKIKKLKLAGAAAYLKSAGINEYTSETIEALNAVLVGDLESEKMTSEEFDEMLGVSTTKSATNETINR